MDTVYNGYDQILYITYNSVELPIGCLTSNGFTENIEFIDTTTTITVDGKQAHQRFRVIV